MKIISTDELNQYKKNKIEVKGLSDNQRIQAQAEILLAQYFWDLENKFNMGLQLDTDVRVNPPTTKDVDIQISYEKLTLNIEVKTPEQDIIEEGKFHAKIAHRYPEVSREEQDRNLKKISNMLYEESGVETQSLKLNDNKVKDYIKGANAKFCERSTESLNILAIMCTSIQMGDFMYFLVNPDSGLLTTSSYIPIDYSKVDYIVISNAVEGIGNPDDHTFDIKEFSKYVTFIFSPHKDLKIGSEVSELFFSIMPNKNKEYCKFEQEYVAELKAGGIPDDMHYYFTWTGYLAKYYPEFSANKC